MSKSKEGLAESGSTTARKAHAAASRAATTAMYFLSLPFHAGRHYQNLLCPD
ncbi:MAG TPA: hypothetical protein PKW80_12810 [Bacteroidales bacterium]|nr:hypothetical protein [Bacteroidales bacterium]